MATVTRTKKIDVDTHYLPRVDYSDLRNLLPKSLVPQAVDMLERDTLRVADPRGVRAALKGEVKREEVGNDPHRDPEARIRGMRDLGFDMQVLIPDGVYMNLYGGAPYGGNPPLEARLAIARLYNNSVGEAQKQHPDSFISSAVVPFDSVEESIREVERVHREHGIRAVVIPANWMDKNFDTLELYPFWEAVNSLGMTLLVHHVPQGCLGAIVDHMPRYPMIGQERMRRLHLGTYLGFGLEYTIAAAALTLGGVLDEFPNLRFCFFEAGGTWLAYAMYGSDRSFMIEPQCSRTKELPSELMKRHCFSAVEPMENISQLVGLIGSENYFFGTDYPHPEYETFRTTVENVESQEGLTDQAKENVLGGNIARVLGVV
jgi:aminocarboxymuconate-semialdehyde decarboxylase